MALDASPGAFGELEFGECREEAGGWPGFLVGTCGEVRPETADGGQSQFVQQQRQSLQLAAAIARLDRFDLLVLDDISYVSKDQAETSVLFELIAARYERRSLLITANQPFGDWGKVFPDPAMTVAAIDRLVHHATIFEMNVESYRQRSAAIRQKQRAASDTKRDTKQKEPITASIK